jgi:putative transposase
LARRILAAARAPVAIGAAAAAGTTRSKRELLLKNALLRHQLLLLGRTAKRPRLTAADRGFLVHLASRPRSWADALVIVRPETVLRWHRQGYRLFWRRKSRAGMRPPRIPSETITLIRQLARENPRWGYGKLQGDLTKLGYRLGRPTIRDVLKRHRVPPLPPGGGSPARGAPSSAAIVARS